MARVEVSPTPPPNEPSAPATAPTPAPTAATPPDAPEPDQDGSIRIAPETAGQAPDKAQLDRANSFYTRKMYDYAIMEYEKFLI